MQQTPLFTAMPSVEAQALSQDLVRVVRERRAQNPALGAQDLEQAVALARQQLDAELGGSGLRHKQVLAMLVAAAIALVGLALGYTSTQAPPLP